MSNICETCNKTFTLKSNLKNHITIDHLKLNPFWCNVCEKSFSTTTALEQHVNTVHKKLKSFQCEIAAHHLLIIKVSRTIQIVSI